MIEGNFLIGFLTPFADSGISYGFGFVFFGTNLAAGIMVYFLLYETKSLALEQVDVMYSQKNLKPWHSSEWMPAGYIDRNKRVPETFERRCSPIGQSMGLQNMRKSREGSESPPPYLQA
ncbi:hypothetical protein WHR41_09431 [Cladosporium halotolerans]|uniref:Uncharacterized protein n=1 Tax=Cladosporium halotolerans TaxID=1052096 RepID=A0AB34KBK7_9PEZI